MDLLIAESLQGSPLAAPFLCVARFFDAD